jgi:hypothetical protein
VAARVSGSGTQSLTALYVAAPFSMGYVDFYRVGAWIYRRL